jgi:hypothetical protein
MLANIASLKVTDRLQRNNKQPINHITKRTNNEKFSKLVHVRIRTHIGLYITVLRITQEVIFV